MKRDAGLTGGVLVAALASFGVYSSLQNKGVGTTDHVPGYASASGQKTPKADGECGDLQDTLRSFFKLTVFDKAEKPASCTPEKEEIASTSADTAAKSPVKSASFSGSGVQYVVATLADPLHTHLPLTFDRQTEAIQQAAADECFTFDRSWMPWETTEDPSVFLQDRDVVEERNKQRERQPGVLLFRRSVSNDCHVPVCSSSNQACDEAADPYKNGLIVFVAGEEPTEGIHEEQFKNAFQWIRYLGQQGIRTRGPVSILGPSFSGSLPSLAQLLSAVDVVGGLAAQVSIFSGQVTSNEGVRWFTKLPVVSARKVNFVSFQIDDDTTLKRYRGFLDEISPKKGQSRLAIISEDETAYGYHPVDASEQLDTSPGKSGSRCRAPCNGRKGTAWFYYPRDISALRAAYQEQAVFNRDASAGADTTRRTLKSDLADPEGKAHDTVKSYGASQTALSQEAVLLQIVSMLRAHNSQFLLLRSSNPLDALFLAKFFRTTYPEGRVVVQGNDLLLRRDIGVSGLNGTMSLETYPVLPAADDWMGWTKHSHRAFTQDGAQGTYIALRYLLPKESGTSSPATFCTFGQDGDPNFAPLMTDTREGCSVPGYSPPFWLASAQDNPPGKRPSTWITVLGNDGFSPVAAIGERDRKKHGAWASVWESLSALAVQLKFWGKLNLDRYTGCWPDVPLSMNICMLSVFSLTIFHLICCLLPSVTVKPEHRSYYARFTCGSAVGDEAKHHRIHVALLLAVSVLLVLMATVTSWGYGWLYNEGEPIPDPVVYRAFPFVVWALGIASLLANGWVERRLSLQENPELSFPTWGEIGEVLKNLRVALLAYVAATFFFYLLFSAGIDGTLPPSVRVLTYLRSVHLTTGVSPSVPLLLLIVGMYGWCWYALRGHSLFGEDRPRLPPEHELLLPAKEWVQAPREQKQFFSPMGRELVADKIEMLCQPFSRKLSVVLGLCFGVLVAGSLFLCKGVPLRSLGTDHYSYLVCVWIGISISMLVANVWQLTRIWLMLRTLLSFLDRLPLRRSIIALSEYSWSSIWKMSGNVLDFRYKLFYCQFGTINHLKASLTKIGPSFTAVDATRLIKAIDDGASVRSDFAEWYSRNWSEWKARDLSSLRKVQEETAKFAGKLLTEILVPAWVTEANPTAPIQAGAEDGRTFGTEASIAIPLHIRNAEEFVCLIYLAFIQNVLGRMRALVTGMVWLFLSIAFVLPSYPFDPRPVLTGAVVCLFLIAGAAVFVVYSQMFRNATLSHLTNTKPGELGGEFWFKLISFGIGPALGLMASIFPDLSNSLLGAMLPSLSSLK